MKPLLINTSSTSVPGRQALRFGSFSTVWRPRTIVVVFLLLVATIFLLATSIGLGDYPISPIRVLQVLFGGQGTRIERLVVLNWRMPRALAAVFVGCALGLSGALTQTITRNPLASPDILAITTGASAAAVSVIILGGSTGGFLGWLSSKGIPIAAVLGAALTAAVMWLLAWRRSTDSFRLVLFGITISALLTSYINLLMIRARLRDASAAQFWLTGSLNSADWLKTWPIAVVILIVTPLLAWIGHQLLATQLGTDTARSLGQNVNTVQVILFALAVALAAVAVSVAGPIGFIAFVSPQVALRLCNSASPPLVASALTGAMLLLLADICTQALLPVELPVGILTSAIGGIFLIYVLIQQLRKSSI